MSGPSPTDEGRSAPPSAISRRLRGLRPVVFAMSLLALIVAPVVALIDVWDDDPDTDRAAAPIATTPPPPTAAPRVNRLAPLFDPDTTTGECLTFGTDRTATFLVAGERLRQGFVVCTGPGGTFSFRQPVGADTGDVLTAVRGRFAVGEDGAEADASLAISLGPRVICRAEAIPRAPADFDCPIDPPAVADFATLRFAVTSDQGDPRSGSGVVGAEVKVTEGAPAGAPLP